MLVLPTVGDGRRCAVGVKSGVDDVPNVGIVSWTVQEQQLGNGRVGPAMLQQVRVLDEDREIGREDPRFALVAEYLGVF